MRIYSLLFAAGILALGSAHAGPILQFDATTVGTSGGNPVLRLTYTLSGVSFLSNQELEIQFDPTLYGTLSNGAAPAGFDLALFQPNNPPGTTGVYSALALVDIPSLASGFRVDAVYLGQGTPASQPFFINQYTDTGAFRVIGSGTATPLSPPPPTGVPEPATFAGVGTALALIVCALRRRRPEHPA